MADDSTKQTIEIEYVVIADKAVQDSIKLQQRIQQSVLEIQKTAAESGTSFKVAADSLKAAYGAEQLANIQRLRDEIKTLNKNVAGESTTDMSNKILGKREEINARIADWKQYKTSVTEALRTINSEQKQVTAGTKEMGSATSALGTIGKFVFGSILGITAASALRGIINYFKEATKAGFEYAQALLRLQASTQILQESGMNISMKETLDLVNQLNRQFPIFTRKQVVEGIGYIQLLSQNLTLTNEQMKNLAEVGGALAVVLGKDLNEASKELALFLSSGYGEALQRAGILASKASVQHELLAMGIKQGYNEVDAATRAQAGYNVIMQQSSKIVEKATQLQKDQAFTLVKSKNAWEQMKDTLGLRLVPVMAIVYEMGIRLLKGLDALALGATAVFTLMEAKLSQVAASIQLTYKVLSQKPSLEGLKEFADDWNKVWSQEGWDKARKITRETLLPDIFNNFKDSAIGAGNAAEEQAMIIADSVELLHEKIVKEQKDFAKDMYDANVDFVRDIAELNQDAERKVAESWSNYYADIASVIRKANDAVIGENIKFQLDLTQINREYSQKREDAEQKYRDREAKAEKDFQEKLRRLREEFLFDLEDALRERDARQVLRLIRRFNLEQDRLNRERISEREDRANEYRRELEEIDRQKAERLQKLNEEHQARIAEIARQGSIELRELKIKHDAELAEIAARLAQEKADRAADYLQKMADLKTQYQERINEITAELLGEYTLTSGMVELIGAEYTRIYGPNGVIQTALASYIAYLGVVQASIASMNAAWQPGSFSGSEPKGYPYYSAPINSGARATGAKDWAVTSPRTITVGEVPEMVNITPLNRLSSSDMGSKDGTITVELLLSPDLQARVIDNTMTEVANVMLDIQRRR